jgi:hypothetical protein
MRPLTLLRLSPTFQCRQSMISNLVLEIPSSVILRPRCVSHTTAICLQMLATKRILQA